MSERRTSFRQELFGDTLMPLLTKQQEEEEDDTGKQRNDIDDEVEPEDILEWIGCQALGIDL